MLHIVILAGGSGSRLWPLSRVHYPKQFLRLLGPHTLLQQTVLRLGTAVPPERLWFVTGKEQAHIVRAQLSALPFLREGTFHILAEPLPKNTAAAIGLAAVSILRQDPQAVLAVMPADHWIAHESVFVELIHNAVGLTRQNKLVTLGIVPDRPETGYGYVRRGPVLSPSTASATDGTVAYQVEQFVEKPDLATARRYMESGAYYWNAGIFLWQASTILEEIAAYLPDLFAGLAAIAGDNGKDGTEKTVAAAYEKLESISIDYGVLEKSTRVLVVPADIGWSDLGDWTAIYRLSPRDERGNTLSPNVLTLDSENSFVYGGGRTIATIGLKDTIVIDTEDALLICPVDRSQEVRAIVQQLVIRGMDSGCSPRTVHRPWGAYTVLEEGDHFKVKRIVVEPGAALSLQLHHQRSEYWVVIAGVAQVVTGDKE